MKCFFVTYRTNYGLSVMIIAAHDKEQSLDIALAKGAWIDSLDSNEIILPATPGIILQEES